MKYIYKLKLYSPKPGVLSYLSIFLQTAYFIIFIIKDIPGYSFSGNDILSMVSGIIALLLLSNLFDSLLFSTILRKIFIPIYLFIIWAMNSYQLETGSPLDFSLVKDNIGISFSREAFMMISSPFSSSDLISLMIIFSAVVFSEYRFSFMENPVKGKLNSGISSLLLWILFLYVPYQTGDGLTLFIKSGMAYNRTEVYAQPVTEDYPYEKKNISVTSVSSTIPASKRNKPNIFIIMIESLNANFIEAKSPEGIYFTPNLNSLIKRGIYFDRFYGNSVQTCKGQAAIFFSILPSFKGKLFVDYPDLNVVGFPSILADYGYQTIFFQAFHNLKFDNTKNNMLKAGFSVVKSFSEYRKKEDKSSIWGWGVEDKIFYERFFEMLDSLHKQTPDKPVFAALMTIGTHIPCDGMPVEKRGIYKNPQNIKEKYSNALLLSDSQLPRFFELLKERSYLENSIIIITSDHSFPMKEHGIYNNEICFYDETFRIPFLIIWDGVLKPERIRDIAYSQIDIGPTITDLLGISKTKNNMTGISVFNRTKTHPVYLIQPYNGRFLEVVEYPLKYIQHLKTGKEYLFNLEDDPGERINLVSRDVNIKTVNDMKQKLSTVYLNQQLIDENRIMKK